MSQSRSWARASPNRGHYLVRAAPPTDPRERRLSLGAGVELGGGVGDGGDPLVGGPEERAQCAARELWRRATTSSSPGRMKSHWWASRQESSSQRPSGDQVTPSKRPGPSNS